MNFKHDVQSLISQMTLEEKVNQLSYRTHGIERLNIKPYVYWNEGLHGVGRAGIASVFPQAIGLAATFNESLIKKVAYSIGVEARAKFNQAIRTIGYSDIYQGITIWSPNINIFRDPRWGRGQETYGEDPYLTLKMGTSFVKGLQTYNKQGYRLTDATIKHYYAHSGPENTRHQFNALVSEHDQNETYKRAFKEIIKRAKPKGVMGAYNRVNDQLCCGSTKLIHDEVRKLWGHKGYFVSDCWAIEDFHLGHKVTSSPLDSAVKALKSGCDLSCGDVYAHLIEAYHKKMITDQDLNSSLDRLLTSRFELGMFDPKCSFHTIPIDVINSDKHQKINLKAAEESIVLLKNNGILPLKEDAYSKIAVIGNNSDNLPSLLGNYHGTAEEPISLYQGIKKIFKNAVVKKAEGCTALGVPKPWMFQPLVEAISLAEHSDLILLALGIDPTIEGEENDAIHSLANGDKLTINYSQSQLDLIQAIQKLNKPTILINVSGSAMVIPDNNMDAVIQQFYGGQYAGLALAKMLIGKVNPSGRLPITFYKNVSDLPDFDNYSMKNRTYKYAEGPIQFPFGSGLSYSSFTYQKIRCTQELCELDLTNTSKVDGFETVLIFGTYHEMLMPKYELIGFKKIFIKHAQSMHLKIKLEPYHKNQSMTLFIGSEHPLRSNTTLVKLYREESNGAIT